MSGFSYFKPSLNSNVFNPASFRSEEELTMTLANSLFIKTNDVRLPYITSITPGTAAASKALVLDVNRDISNINNLTATVTANISNASSSSISNGLVIQHSLTSGTPSNNNFGIGTTFNGPNTSSSIVSYARIFAMTQLATAGAHQGSLNFSTVIAGAFNNCLSLSSLTTTQHLLHLTGATSTVKSYNFEANVMNITNSSSSATSLINLITDNQTWEIGARGSTNGSNPTNLYIYNGATRMTMTPAGITTFSNDTASTAYTNGALITAGGIGVAKASYFNSNVTMGTSTGGVMIGTSTDSARLLSCLQSGLSPGNSNYITFGASDTLNNQVELSFKYSAVGSVSNRFEIGFFGTSRFFSLTAAGNLNLNTPLVTAAQVNIQSTTNNLALTYDSTHYTQFSNKSNGALAIVCNSAVANPAAHTFYFDSPDNSTAPRMSLSGSSPPISVANNFRLGFGAHTADYIISLYNTSTTTPTHGIGVNNNQLLINSAGTSGHGFYNSSGISGAGANTNKGDLKATIDVFGNIIAQAGIHAVGSTVSTVTGAHMTYSGDTANFFGFNVNTLATTDVSIANYSLFIKGSNGYVGINQVAPTAPLDINGASTTTSASSFGFLASTGAGSAAGFTDRYFSAKFSHGLLIASGEINVLSDIHFKENIADLSDTMVNKFIKNIKPISYKYKDIDTPYYGYSAQNILLNNFTTIVGTTSTDLPLDARELENEDGDKIIIPADTRLLVNQLSIIPILHKAIQLSNDRITELENQLNKILSVFTPSLLRKLEQL